MGIFNRLKIRTKLIIMVTLFLIALLLVSIIGTINYKKAIKATGDIYNKNVIAIEKLSDAQTQTRSNFANVLNCMVTKEETSRETLFNDYKNRTVAINSDLNEYEKLTKNNNDTYDKKQISLIKANMNSWNEISDRMIELVKTNQSDDAVALFKISGEGIFEKLQTSIQDLNNYNIKQAEKIYLKQEETGKTVTKFLIIFVLFITAVCILVAELVTKSISKPILKVISLIKKTSDLDLSNDTSYDHLLKFNNEVGIIAQSVEGLRNELRKVVESVLNISTNVAASSEELAASTEENTKTINQIVNAINEIAQGNNSQADMVSKTNQTIMTMASKIDEVNHETVTNSDNAEKSMGIIQEGQKAVELTVEKMAENKEVTGEVGKSIEDLSMQIEKVSNIISVIKDISSQTNLLALNASIEAARAGESGRGFAVVATEIGSLAQETDSAVDEITKIIMDTVARSTRASEKMSTANNIVLEQENAINITKESFDKIKISVEDITEHTMNISQRITEIDQSSNEIADKTQDMSAIAEEAAASSEEISASNEEQLASIEMIASAANELSKMATDLNNEVSKFKI